MGKPIRIKKEASENSGQSQSNSLGRVPRVPGYNQLLKNVSNLIKQSILLSKDTHNLMRLFSFQNVMLSIEFLLNARAIKALSGQIDLSQNSRNYELLIAILHLSKQNIVIREERYNSRRLFYSLYAKLKEQYTLNVRTMVEVLSGQIDLSMLPKASITHDKSASSFESMANYLAGGLPDMFQPLERVPNKDQDVSSTSGFSAK